ncbi:MAG: Uma2 family endonuclease [Tepidisphaerales bacterium]
MRVAQPHPPPATPFPPLANGDRLTREEFHRRYERMPHLKKAELIEGVVYMPSPVRVTHHGQPHAHLTIWLGHYVALTPGVGPIGDNSTVRLDEDNEVQPDLFLLLPPSAGGAAEADADGYISGPPDLVCEVAASSVSIDLHDKKNAYRRNRVREYLVWRVEDAEVDWFALRNGDYEKLRGGSNGHPLLKSEAFPGLWLDVPALLRGDLPALLAAVDRGAASSQHAAFLRRLRKPRKR